MGVRAWTWPRGCSARWAAQSAISWLASTTVRSSSAVAVSMSVPVLGWGAFSPVPGADAEVEDAFDGVGADAVEVGGGDLVDAGHTGGFESAGDGHGSVRLR